MAASKNVKVRKVRKEIYEKLKKNLQIFYFFLSTTLLFYGIDHISKYL